MWPFLHNEVWGRLCQFLLSFFYTEEGYLFSQNFQGHKLPNVRLLKILQPYIPSSKVLFSRIFGKYIVWINWKNVSGKIALRLWARSLIEEISLSTLRVLNCGVSKNIYRPTNETISIHTSKMKTLQTSVPFGRPINQPEQSIRIQICFIITFCDALHRVVECRVHL